MMITWNIERLNKSHDRSQFDCGVPELNHWIKNLSGQFDRRDLSRTYVAVQKGEKIVSGFYAISTHRVLYEVLPDEEAKGLPRLDVPVVLLGRLAIDTNRQGEGLGALLLVDVLKRSLQISEQIGIRAVEVEAINESARKFYMKFGFRTLRDDTNHLLMPMHEIRKLKLNRPWFHIQQLRKLQ